MKKAVAIILYILPLVAQSSINSMLHLASEYENDSLVNKIVAKEDTKYMLITDQSVNRIAMVDVDKGGVIWEWEANEDTGIRAQDVPWFNAPSDAKPVYDGKYILLNASGGGVALVRIADKKTMFYAYAGGNTHSAELLPDGNIVSASSTGNYLMIFRTDTLHFPDAVYTKKIPMPFAHNVVWDHQRQCLWTAAKDQLYALRYTFDCRHPDLIITDSTHLPDTDAHDLFPVYGKDALWLTTPQGIFTIDADTKKVQTITGPLTEDIKSVSSGAQDVPTLIMYPREQWWADEVLDIQGNRIFRQQGLKIYKARWLLPNRFSYPEHDSITLCQF